MQPDLDKSDKQRAKDKLARIPVKIQQSAIPKKPDWIRVKLPSTSVVTELKSLLRERKLVTVCEEASCPNLPECFSKGTATFMIMGDKCTRRCSFCDVAHGKPDPLDPLEPQRLAETIAQMKLKYVVVTSVDRDDLRDGGAGHFSACIGAIRELTPHVKIEILVPDYRGRMERALEVTGQHLPDVFNHNIETVARLYREVRAGADYQWSLRLLQEFKIRYPNIPTKSGAMLGMGEEMDEVIQLMKDLRAHDVDMLTLGQYLQPSTFHYPIKRYVHPDEFAKLAEIAKTLGFKNVASGPLVRSSYHADLQAEGVEL